MTRSNSNNERIKRKYFVFLKEAKQLSEQTLDAVASSLNRFETYNKHKDFKVFHFEQAVGFKHFLAQEKNQRTGKALSKSSIHAILVNLRSFFEWLYGQQGFKSRFSYSDASYFNLSLKDVRVAQASTLKASPTVEQIKHTLVSMPHSSPVELRNRALIAFTFLTGARVSALASAKLKHVDLNAGLFMQDASEVNTKFSKTFPTYFFPIGDDVVKIITEWIFYLKKDLLWGEDDPLFPSTLIEIGESSFYEAAGLERKHWLSTSPIRRIFSAAFEQAGLQDFKPHSFRNTLVRLGESACISIESFKAWSQNLGHEGVLTTLHSYGTVSTHRQAELIRQVFVNNQSNSLNTDELITALLLKLKKADQEK